MERYHKNIYWPKSEADKLPAIVKRLNGKAWIITQHSFERIIEKSKKADIDLVKIGQYIKDILLSLDNVFEFYKEDGAIIKIVFRIPYNENHLVLVVSDFKSLITVYYNDKNDHHSTLKSELYMKGA